MKVEKRDGSDQRRILTGMIVSRAVLARIAPKWTKEGLFRSPFANLIGSWCVKFLTDFDKAPCKSIESLYEAWASDGADKDTAALVERFLEALDGEYVRHRKELNADHLVDLASKYFQKVQVSRLQEQLEGFVESGDLLKAEKAITSYNRIEVGASGFVNVLSDKEACKSAIESKTEPIIKYDGALGEFFGGSLERDGFVAILAPEKAGKSFLLQDIAWQAMLQERRVAFFAVGDMSEHQMMRRFQSRAALKPIKVERGGRKVKWPKSLHSDPDGERAEVEHDLLEFDAPLSWEEGYKAFRRLAKGGRADNFRLSVHANSSISVSGVKGILSSWERQGFLADLVLIDYADILAPLSGSADTRDAINATWKGLRALSQTMHNLVVTATQSNAASYYTETMDRSNFSEDKRKYAHVTGMFAINSSTQEKNDGVMRLNWLQLRDDSFDEGVCCHVAGCLALASPFVLSTF